MAVTPIQKGRLGRGLAAMIGEQNAPEPRLPDEGVQRVVPVDQLNAGELNPRQEFREDELTELADSIRQKGLVQPLIVRETPNFARAEAVQSA